LIKQSKREKSIYVLLQKGKRKSLPAPRRGGTEEERRLGDSGRQFFFCHGKENRLGIVEKENAPVAHYPKRGKGRSQKTGARAQFEGKKG